MKGLDRWLTEPPDIPDDDPEPATDGEVYPDPDEEEISAALDRLMDRRERGIEAADHPVRERDQICSDI